MERIKLIIGPRESGKSTIVRQLASSYDDKNVVFVDGRRGKNHFFYSACNNNTELIIIEELKSVNDIMSIYGDFIDGIKVEKRFEAPFCIKSNIIVTCSPCITREDLPLKTSMAFNRRFEVIECVAKDEKQIIDTVSVFKKGLQGRHRFLYSNSKWFNDCQYFTIKDNGECITIQKQIGVNITKKSYKFSKSRRFCFESELPIGKFEINKDESDEDTLVIYYK
jgi:energy-coupling factor transporter ATP-binding protein EcfA2